MTLEQRIKEIKERLEYANILQVMSADEDINGGYFISHSRSDIEFLVAALEELLAKHHEKMGISEKDLNGCSGTAIESKLAEG